MDGACDREALARDAIFKSLEDIGRRKFSTVLETAHGYLTKHNKVRENTAVACKRKGVDKVVFLVCKGTLWRVLAHVRLYG